MFYHIRFQTGELKEFSEEIKRNTVPCLEVTDLDEYSWVCSELIKYGVFYRTESEPDRNARDRIKEPEFEFRAAFSDKETGGSQNWFADIYMEQIPDKDYDSIFGD